MIGTSHGCLGGGEGRKKEAFVVHLFLTSNSPIQGFDTPVLQVTKELLDTLH
jgi:hypothetical protein